MCVCIDDQGRPLCVVYAFWGLSVGRLERYLIMGMAEPSYSGWSYQMIMGHFAILQVKGLTVRIICRETVRRL